MDGTVVDDQVLLLLLELRDLTLGMSNGQRQWLRKCLEVGIRGRIRQYLGWWSSLIRLLLRITLSFVQDGLGNAFHRFLRSH